MTLYRAAIEVLIEADGESEAMDAVAEMLRPLLQDDSCNMLDWQYAQDPETQRYRKPTEISPDVAQIHFDEFTA